MAEFRNTVEVYKKLYQGFAKNPIEFESNSQNMRFISSQKSLLIWNMQISIVFFGIISSIYALRLMIIKPELASIWITALQAYLGLCGIFVLLLDFVIRFCGQELVYSWNCLLETRQIVRSGRDFQFF